MSYLDLLPRAEAAISRLVSMSKGLVIIDRRPIEWVSGPDAASGVYEHPEAFAMCNLDSFTARLCDAKAAKWRKFESLVHETIHLRVRARTPFGLRELTESEISCLSNSLAIEESKMTKLNLKDIITDSAESGEPFQGVYLQGAEKLAAAAAVLGSSGRAVHGMLTMLYGSMVPATLQTSTAQVANAGAMSHTYSETLAVTRPIFGLAFDVQAAPNTSLGSFRLTATGKTWDGSAVVQWVDVGVPTIDQDTASKVARGYLFPFFTINGRQEYTPWITRGAIAAAVVGPPAYTGLIATTLVVAVSVELPAGVTFSTRALTRGDREVDALFRGTLG